MKTKLLLLPMLFFSSIAAFSQSNINSYMLQNPQQIQSNRPVSQPSSRNSNCATDTLLYSMVKEIALGTNQYGALALNSIPAGGLNAVSQAYIVNAQTTVKGISFYVYAHHLANALQAIHVNVSLYNIGGTNNPTTVIATIPTTVFNASPKLLSVNFTNPVLTPGNYAVVIENASNTLGDTLAVIMNKALTTTYGENLAHYKLNTGWLTPSGVLGGNIAYEPIVAPIVSYPIVTDYTVSPNTVCTGNLITFTNTSTPGFLTNRMYSAYSFLDYFNLAPNDSTFEWDFGDGSALKDSTNAHHTFATNGINVTTLTTSAGFWNTCTDSDFLSVPVSTSPVVTVSYRDTICQGEIDTLLAISSGLSTYSWAGHFGNPIYVSPTTTTSYTVAVSNSSGCTTTRVVPVVVKPKPFAAFTTNTTNAPTVVFTSTSTNASAYLWNFGDNTATATTQNAIHVYAPGTYTVILTVANDCGIDTASKIITISAVGISINTSINEIKLFPNPTNGIIYLQLNAEKTKVEILNVIGEVISTHEFNSANAAIDLSTYSEGIYYVKISSASGIVVKQVTRTK